MEGGERDAGEGAGGEFIGELGDAAERGAGGGLVGRVDGGGDDVDLGAFAGALGEGGVEVCAVGGRDDAGRDGGSAGGEAVDDGDVEVAEERDGERARDGCGGHDEHVGRGAVGGGAFAEGGALGDAEAVLFVDDGEGEAFELDRLGEERVGADEDVDLAGGEAAEDVGAGGAGDGAGEHFESDARAREERGEGALVLLGEDFGRGHDGGLMAGGDGLEHGADRDGGFAGADVALEQAIHGCGAGEVAGDLADGLLLAAGEREGQAGADVFFDPGVPLERRGEQAGAEPGAAEGDADLQEEEFVVGEAAARGADFFFGGGRVLGAVGVGEGGECAVGAEGGVEVVFDEGERGGEVGLDGALDDGRGAGFRGRVDGAEGFFLRGARRRVLEDGEFGVGDLDAAAEAFGLALDPDVGAGEDLVFDIGHVEPDKVEPRGAVVQDGFDAGALAANKAGSCDLASGADDAAGLDVGDGGFGFELFVAEGDVGDEPAEVGEAEGAEGGGVLRADAAEPVHRRRERDRCGGLAHARESGAAGPGSISRRYSHE